MVSFHHDRDDHQIFDIDHLDDHHHEHHHDQLMYCRVAEGGRVSSGALVKDACWQLHSSTHHHHHHVDDHHDLDDHHYDEHSKTI